MYIRKKTNRLTWRDSFRYPRTMQTRQRYYSYSYSTLNTGRFLEYSRA
jgi:hypothetical protein